MPEIVLVTGATGFVGRHLTNALQAAGHTVHTHSSNDSDITQGLPEYSGVTHIFHLAGRTFVPDSWQNPAAFYSTNVQGTVTALEFCRRHGASMTLLSSYVYGIPVQLPIDEQHPVTAVNPYAHSKILAEEAAGFYATMFGLRVCVIRPFNLYGPDQDRRFLIPELIEAALDPVTPTIEVADLTPRRDYMHVQDLVALLISAMTARSAGVYNAGSGYSIGVDELASFVREYSGTGKRVVSRNQSRPNEIPDVVADIAKARNQLGWEPKIEWQDALRLLIAREKARRR